MAEQVSLTLSVPATADAAGEKSFSMARLGEQMMDWATCGWVTDQRAQRWSNYSLVFGLGFWLVLLGLDVLAQGSGGSGGSTGGIGTSSGASRAQAQKALTAGKSLLVVIRWAVYIVGSIFVLWGFGTLERNGWIKVAIGALMLTWELWVALVTNIASGEFTNNNDLPDLRN